jgi:hypothetical protein
MTIEVALRIVKVKGEKVKYVVKCLAFELYTEGDTVGFLSRRWLRSLRDCNGGAPVD